MDIVISGASGLIGTALTGALRREGHRVRPLVRRAVTAGEEAIAWDPAAGRIDAPALEGIDAVVHLAGEGIGEHRWSDEQKRRILESRTLGTALLARTVAALDRPPSVFVSGSAIGFYGEGGDRILTEADPAGDAFLSDVCVQWEAAAQPAVDAGIRVPFLRTGIVLDPHGGALAKLLPLFRFGLGGRMGSGRQWWSWVSVEDEVGAIAWLLDHDVAGPVNVTAPTPVTNAEFTKVLAEVLHRPAFLPVPAFGPKLLMGAELADELLFLSQRVQPTVLEAAGYPFRHRDLAGALHALLDAPAAA